MATTNSKSKTYLKNVGKSFGYAAMDVFEHYNPTLTNLYKSSKDAVTEAKRLSREAKMQLQQAEVDSDKGGMSYILEDLASGKWYNKERQSEDERYLSTIAKEEDWGDDTTASAVADTARDVMKQNEASTRKISDSLGGAAQSISTSIGYASAQSADYIVKSFGAQSRALYGLTANGFDRVTNVLLSINNSIDGIASMGEGLNSHMKNSAIFYINATQSLNRIDTNIEKLVKLQEAANKPARGISRKNTKGIENLVDSDGNIDLVAYMKMVKDNMDQYKSLAEALKDNKEDWIGNRKGGNMLSNTVVSVVDAMIPKMTKEAMKLMNDTIKDAMFAGLARGGMKARRSNNPVANLLGEMFLPKDGYKDKLDTRNYEKGQVAWDGIARKSLVEVIPTYLAKIYAALGGEEKYFDYESGKFVKLEQIKADHEYDKRVAAVRAGGKMRTDILADIRKNAPAQRQAQLENEVESFFLQAFVDGYDFVEIAHMINDANFRRKYGITRESAKYIIDYVGAKDATKARRATGFAAGVARGRNEFGNTMRRKEASGTSNLVYTSHGFDGGPAGNAINQFATMTDSFGKTQAYYLRGIYMMTGNIYGTLQGQVGGSYRVRPDRRATASTYFNPDTGRYSRRRPRMTGGERSNMDNRQQRQATSGINRNNNGITIEDRAKYYGMSDEQILDMKRKENMVKRAQEAFNGQQITPIQGTTEDGQPRVRSKFGSALAKVKDWYQAPFAAMTDMINSFTVGINNMFWGTKERKGLIDKISDYMKNLWTKVFGDENGQGGIGLGAAISEEWTKIKTKVKDKARNFMGNVGARDRAAGRREVAEAVMNQLSGTQEVPAHARGRRITKTGLIAVSEGELVIPSEFNPYYSGRTNKKQQIRNENRIINRFYGGFANGGTVGGMQNAIVEEFVDPETNKTMYKITKPDGSVRITDNKTLADKWRDLQVKHAINSDGSVNHQNLKYMYETAKNSASRAAQAIDENTGALTAAKDGANLLGSGIMGFIKASLFGTEKQQEEDKKKINMKMTDIFKEMGHEKGAMGIGAIGGLGVSLLTGAIVGPLAGAALGAGAGLLAKSEKVQKMLFGEVDENGNYEKEFGNFVMKKLPNIGITAGLGLAGGALLGSPILGLIAGSAVGFAGQSESVKKRLFGDIDPETGERSKGGLINKELRDRIKKAAPNIAAGGIAGLLIGPFGIAGNLIVGSAMGYLSTSEKFHNYFFGDGKDDKGLAGIINDKIIKNLDDLFHNTGNAMKGWLRKTGNNISKKISMAIDKAREDYNKGNARGLRKALGWAAEVPGRALKGAANAVGGITKRLADGRRERNLARGYDVWNAEKGRNASASERLAMRSEDDMSTAAAIDKLIAGADEKGLDELHGLLNSVLNPDAELSKKRSQARSTLYADLYDENKMGGQLNARLIDKIVKTAGQGEAGNARLESILDKYGIKGDQRKAIMSSFGSADQAILGAKDTDNYKEGQLQLLSDKYGINLLGRNNSDITNYLKAIEHDKTLRYGEDSDPTIERDEKYQNNVVTLLEEINNNAKLYFEQKGIRQSEEGTYSSTVDKNGNTRYYKIENGKKVRVSNEEGRAGSLGQRNIGERFTDAKSTAADTVKTAMENIKEPVKEALTETVKVIDEKVVSPLAASVKSVMDTAKDLYGIAAQGYRDANPDIDTSEYYGPRSQVDIVNRLGRVGSVTETFGRRILAGGRNLIGAISGKAEGGAIGGDNTFLDMLADKVIEKVGGIGDYLKGKMESTKEKITTHVDAFGNVHKMTTNNQGETVAATNDSTTKKSKAAMDKFMNSVNSIPGMATAITGLSGMFGGLKDKLLGGEEEKGPGLLEQLVKGLFDDTDGFIPNIIAFFTGKKTGGKLFGGSSLSSVFTNFIAPALLLGGFAGVFDNAIKEATNGAYGKKDNEEYYSKETGEVITKTEDGTYVDSNGNVVEGQVGIRQNDVANFSDKLKENTARGILTNRKSVASTILGRTNTGKSIASFGKKAVNVIQNSGDDIASMAARMDFQLTITDGIKKFTGALKKCKLLAPIADSLDNLGAELAEKACKALGSSAAKSLANVASNLVVWAKIAFIVIDFTTGYEDARTTLGIIDEPTVPQKIIAGLLRAIKNFIPIVGTLIPDSLVIDVFCKYVAPAFGIEPEGLMKQREEAQATVDAYNAEHGTSYSVGEYNKAVLKDYTWTERIGNAAKSTGNAIKDKWNSEISAIKEKGLGGAIKDGVKENVDIFKQAYAEKGGGIFGAISAGGDVLANMLPGVFGEIAQKNAEITALATKGDLAGMWKVSLSDFSKGAEGEANVGIFSKIIGQIPLIFNKITRTPMAVVAKFVGPLIEKVGEGFKGIIEGGKYLFSLPKTVAADTKELVYSSEDTNLKDFFDVSKYEQQGENGFFNGIIKATAMTTRIASLGTMIIGAVGKRIGKAFVELKDKVVNTGKAFITLDTGITKKALEGDISNMFSYVGQATSEDSENPLGFLGKVYGYTTAAMRTPLALMSKAGKAISSWFGNIKDKVVTSVTTMATMDQNITAKAKEGDITGMFDYVAGATSEDAENPLGFVGKVYGYINAAGKVPFALLSKAGQAISGWFGEKVDAFKTDVGTLNYAKETLKGMSQDKSSSVGDIMGYTTEFSENNVFKGIFNAIFGFQKIFYSAAKLLGNVFDAISGVVDGKVEDIKEGAKNLGNNIKQGAKNARNTVSGWGEAAWDGLTGWITGSGSGFVSQYDPRYQNYKVSGQNFAAKGCGPAVAAMAGRALGKNISVNDAVNGSVGYQNGNGVSIDYFQQMLGSKGINTRYISGGSSADLYNSIASGEKVVLLGRDPHNTSKEYSPFGPNNHYVLATGIDRRGNVIINDPEAKGPRAYSPAILNSAKFGVAGSNSGIGRRISTRRSNKLRHFFSGGSSYDTPIAQQVWAFFISKGYSPECTAGIMGNMYAESAMNPTAIQGGGKGPAAGICQWENYNTQSGRWKNLYEYAKGNGKSWTDLDMQLNFVHHELTSKDIDNRLSGKTAPSNISKTGLDVSKAIPYAQWKVCTDIPTACCLFEAAFERAGVIAMEKRINAATAYYNLYSGKSYTYDGSIGSAAYTGAPDTSTSTGTSNTSGSTDSGSQGLFSNIWNVVGDIGTAFSNAFSKAFNKGGLSSTGSTGSSGSSYSGSSDFVVSNAAVGEGNAKQKALAQSLLDLQGKLSYSMSGPRNPEQGSADCSSTVNWAYKKITGTDIGNNTGAIIDSNATEVIDLANNMDPSTGGTNSSGPNESKLMPGDILLYSRPTSDYTAGRKYRVGHVEMYVGNGKRIGHGGGMGPKVTEITKDASRYIQARRLKGITAAGSGLVSYEDLANMSGGSSGILMKARPGSRNNIPVRLSNGRLVPVSNFSGGATDIMTSQTQAMLTNISNTASRSNSGISPELVTKLLTSITQILQNIANNTAPVGKIYQALLAYVQAGGDSGIKNDNPTPIKVDKTRNNQTPEPEIDSSIATLVGVLAELAKG